MVEPSPQFISSPEIIIQQDAPFGPPPTQTSAYALLHRSPKTANRRRLRRPLPFGNSVLTRLIRGVLLSPLASRRSPISTLCFSFFPLPSLFAPRQYVFECHCAFADFSYPVSAGQARGRGSCHYRKEGSHHRWTLLAPSGQVLQEGRAQAVSRA